MSRWRGAVEQLVAVIDRLVALELPVDHAGEAGLHRRQPAELIRQAAVNRELNRPSIGTFDAERLALLIWSRLHGHADLVLSVYRDRDDGLHRKILSFGVRSLITLDLPLGLPSFAHISEQLHMSESSLRRRWRPETPA